MQRQAKRKAARPHKAVRKHHETAIVRHQPAQSSVALALVSSAVPNVAETIQNLEAVRRFVTSCLNTDLQRALAKLKAESLDPEAKAKKELAVRNRLEIDWGTIPGVEKPFLKQPGAEKVMFWLHLRPTYVTVPVELAGGHLEVVSHVILKHKKTGEEVFEGPDCSCSSMESNFRFRWADTELHPPKDEAEKLKAAGLGKWRKKAIYAHGRFVKQEWVWTVPVENSNIHNVRNNVRQIGEKRALVKCVRGLGAMSELFTSDPNEWFAETDNGESAGPYDEQDFTPSGRLITDEKGISPSGTRQTTRKPEPSTGAGRFADSPKIDAGDGKPSASQVAATSPATAPIPPPRVKGTIAITWPAERDGCASISGDLAEILPAVRKAVPCQWLDAKRSWAVPESCVPELSEMLQKAGYPVVEVQTAKASGDASPPVCQPEQKAPDHAAAMPGGAVPDRTPAAGQITGTIREVRKRRTSEKNMPYVEVNVGGTWYKTWVRPLFEYFEQATNLSAELLVDQRHQICGIKRIANRLFEDDGRTPIIQNAELRPTTTGELFK